MSGYYSTNGSSSSSKEEVNRIYVGNLPVSATQSDIEELFQRFGRISRCDIKRTVSGAPFAFLEFEDPRDAKDAIEARDGYNMDGSRLRVEVPFNARPEGSYRRGGGFGDRGGGGGGGGRRGGGLRGKHRVLVSGLPSTGSWQDLKDHMRKAGECGHADVFGDGSGIIEFFRKDDVVEAIRLFDGSTFNSHEGDKSQITVREDDSSGGDRGRDSPSLGRGRGREDEDYGRYNGGGRNRSRSNDRGGYRRDRSDRDKGRDRYRDSPGRGSDGYRGRDRKSHSRDRRDRSRSRSRDRR
eukprot:GHVQ01040079.1.p1 GENE.GHVQ01040079.1~~GHVQ01040079.1.p1  ORF type:complete len:296 (-),score=38.21 GHVQ01040079.1:6216-7103(-)